MRNQRRRLIALGVLAALPLFSALYADSTGKMLDMTLTVRNGTGDDPMIVLWLENDTGDFIQTLHLFSRDKEYRNDLLGWRFKSRKTEKEADVDAICGATICWNKTDTFRVPAQIGSHDLLDGTYVLRIESRKDKGNHYRNFKIPLPPGYAGGLHEDEGYVKSVEIKVQENVEPQPQPGKELS